MKATAISHGAATIINAISRTLFLLKKEKVFHARNPKRISAYQNTKFAKLQSSFGNQIPFRNLRCFAYPQKKKCLVII